MEAALPSGSAIRAGGADFADLRLLQSSVLAAEAPEQLHAWLDAHATDGMISRLQLTRALRERSADPTEAQQRAVSYLMEQLFRTFDSRGHGTVPARSLAAGLALLSSIAVPDKLRFAFRVHGDSLNATELAAFISTALAAAASVNRGLQGTSSQAVARFVANEAQAVTKAILQAVRRPTGPVQWADIDALVRQGSPCVKWCAALRAGPATARQSTDTAAAAG